MRVRNVFGRKGWEKMDDTSFWVMDEEEVVDTSLFDTLCGFCGSSMLISEKDKLAVPDGWKTIEQPSDFPYTILLACDTCIITESL